MSSKYCVSFVSSISKTSLFYVIFIAIFCIGCDDKTLSNQQNVSIATSTTMLDSPQTTAQKTTEVLQYSPSPSPLAKYLTPTLNAQWTPIPTAREGSIAFRWLKNIPCRAPCFEGLKPSITQLNAVKNLFEISPYSVYKEVQKSQSLQEQTRGLMNWEIPDGNGIAQIYYDSNIVQTVTVWLPDSLNLQDVISSYGMPTGVRTTAFPSSDSGERIPSFNNVMLLYLPYGFVLTTDVGTLNKFPPIDQNLRIARVDFFKADEQHLALLLQRLNLDTPKIFTPWKGFNSFAFYCADITFSCRGVVTPTAP